MNVFIMVGPAGAGKSTAAKKVAEMTGAEIFSSDFIREELYGDESIQGDSKEVFSTLFKRARYEASFGCPVIIDSTNLTVKNRRNCMKNFKNIGIPVKFYAVVVDTPIEQAKINNSTRSRHVPEYIIEKHYNTFEYPSIEEGFDKIIHF